MRSPVALLAALVAWSAWAADARIAFLSKQLATAKDPRVRVQAALGLGSTNDIDSIAPLCGALSDTSDIVRSSAAKALAQLADPSSLDCLKQHLNDPSPEVRPAIQHTYDLIDSQQVRSGIGAVYVVLAPTEDKQDKPNPTLAKLTDDRLRAALTSKGVTVAPPGQSRDDSLSAVRAQHLKGFDLRPELHSAPQKGLQLQMFGLTIKDGQLLGQVGATARGPPPPDLIRALAPKLVDEAADEWNWSR
jgi:hypothetical protein